MADPAAKAALPIVAVTGSVGKTTTASLLDRLARGVGRRTVTWLDDGVAIDGRAEDGELRPWGRGLQLLLQRELDLAIQELPAATVQAVGLPASAYQAAIVTNLALNDAELAATPRAARQAAANQIVAAAVHPAGVIVLNADDLAVADLAQATSAASVLWALRRQSPPLARSLKQGGRGLYLGDDRIVWEAAGDRRDLGPIHQLPFTLGGAALMQTQNALAALATGLALGLPGEDLIVAARRVEETPSVCERTLAIRRTFRCRTIVAEARCLLAFRGLARLMGRLTPSPTRVVGVVAWPTSLADWEARETARALAKLFALLYLHGPGSAEAADLVREVRPADRLPAFCVPVESELDAVRRLVKIAASGDVLLLVGARAASTLALLESYG
jgi:cyanophycin synthetase